MKKADLSRRAASMALQRVNAEFKDDPMGMQHKQQGISRDALYKKYYNEEFGNSLATMTSGLTPLDDQ